MATKARHNKLAIALIVLIIVAAALLFYSENPFLFGGTSKPSAISGGTVSVYVLPDEEAGNSDGGQASAEDAT